MRFSMIFKISKPELPVDYRSGFISLLKASYEMACKDKYVELYEANTLKPFTFSVYFGNMAKILDKKVFINSDRFILNFSTASLELGTYFYNGLLKIKKELKEYPLFEARISLENVNLKREIQIREDTIIFKTLSPFLVRDYIDKNKYLKPSDEGFQTQLKQIVSECSKAFLDKDSSIEFKDVKTTAKPPIFHYGAPVDGIRGIFALKGDPDILNLIYQIGLGSRRSQGFGMLEVMR